MIIIYKYTMFFLMLCLITGCSGRYGKYSSEDKQALRALAGSVVGILAAGNTGGAIVGALVADIYNLSSVKYEDKKIESREEAAIRLKQKYEQAEDSKGLDKKAEDSKGLDKKAEDSKGLDKKAEDSKGLDKKAEDSKGLDKKAEDSKGLDKKAEDSKGLDKKAEDKRKYEQKVEKKKNEERVRLFIGESQVIQHTVKAGSPIEDKIQYTVLSAENVQEVMITEKRMLFAENKHFELDTREVVREQGTYLSTINFKVPDYIPNGYCILFTTISNGKSSKTLKTLLHVI
jgi:hypothetical protein